MGVLRRTREQRNRTGHRATDTWLAQALAELRTTSRTPCTLSFFRSEGSAETADTTLVNLVPFLQQAGHSVLNVSGGGASPIAYVTVVPKHLSPSVRGRAQNAVQPIAHPAG